MSGGASSRLSGVSDAGAGDEERGGISRRAGGSFVLALAMLTACGGGSMSLGDSGTDQEGGSYGYPDASIDGSSDGNVGDQAPSFPLCTLTQRCVSYQSAGDWVCLDACSGVDAGDCPSGTACEKLSGCCMGAGCDPLSVYVCVESDSGAGGDAAGVEDAAGSDAAGVDASAGNDAASTDAGTVGDAGADASVDSGAAGDSRSDGPIDGDGGGPDGALPSCTTMQSCVGYPSFGDWVCLESCSPEAGADAGGCPSSMTCTSLSGCCSGVSCSAISAYVCTP